MADRRDGFGAKLRLARERRGITLGEIANRTKISVHALEALERDDYAHLPGGIFSRAFVRSYALEVGLDPEATIEEFLAEFPHDAAVTTGQSHTDPFEDGEALESDRRTAIAFLRLIAISIPLVGLVLYFSSGINQSAPPEEAPPAQSSPVPSPSPDATAPPPAAEQRSPASTNTTGPAPHAVQAAAEARTQPAETAQTARPTTGQLTVTVSASGECWVSATIDGDSPFERLLQAGERHSFEVHRELVLKAGDAGALSMTLNGASAKPLGEAGRVVTARINLTNYKDYLAQP